MIAMVLPSDVGANVIFFFKQKTAYEVRISDWSSDVCSSDRRVAVRYRGVRGGGRDDRAHSRRFGAPVDPIAPRGEAVAGRRRGGRLMEIVLALAIGILTASGLWLLFRPRTFQVVLGLSLLSYAVNLFILAAGRDR